jgi:hypothetical protein
MIRTWQIHHSQMPFVDQPSRVANQHLRQLHKGFRPHLSVDDRQMIGILTDKSESPINELITKCLAPL